MLLATSRRPSAVRRQHHGHDSREHPDRDADDQPEEQLHAERRALDVRRHARRDEGHAIERRFEHERHPRGHPARRGRRTQGGLAVRHQTSLSPALAATCRGHLREGAVSRSGPSGRRDTNRRRDSSTSHGSPAALRTRCWTVNPADVDAAGLPSERRVWHRLRSTSGFVAGRGIIARAPSTSGSLGRPQGASRRLRYPVAVAIAFNTASASSRLPFDTLAATVSTSSTHGSFEWASSSSSAGLHPRAFAIANRVSIAAIFERAEIVGAHADLLRERGLARTPGRAPRADARTESRAEAARACHGRQRSPISARLRRTTSVCTFSGGTPWRVAMSRFHCQLSENRGWRSCE